jgi:hypothetical protein
LGRLGKKEPDPLRVRLPRSTVNARLPYRRLTILNLQLAIVSVPASSVASILTVCRP